MFSNQTKGISGLRVLPALLRTTEMSDHCHAPSCTILTQSTVLRPRALAVAVKLATLLGEARLVPVRLVPARLVPVICIATVCDCLRILLIKTVTATVCQRYQSLKGDRFRGAPYCMKAQNGGPKFTIALWLGTKLNPKFIINFSKEYILI